MSRPRLRRLDCLLATLSIALAAPITMVAVRPAAAQPDTKRVAKEYVDAGLAAHDAGDYDTALTFYAKAYELRPHPLLLFNMAQSHRLAGRPGKALELYRRYLEAEPSGGQSQAARQHAAALEGPAAVEARKADEAARQAEALRAAEAARQAEALRAAEAARQAEASGAAEAARQAEALRVSEAPRETEQARRERRGRGLRVAGIAAGGAGLASFGVAIAFARWARSLSEDLSRPGTVFDPGKLDHGKTAERVSQVAFATGVALVAGGAAVYVIGRRQARAERVALTPLLVSGGIGLAVTGGLP